MLYLCSSAYFSPARFAADVDAPRTECPLNVFSVILARQRTSLSKCKSVVDVIMLPAYAVSEVLDGLDAVELYNHITKLLECATCHCDEIIIFGDFNVDLSKHVNGRLSKIFKNAGIWHKRCNLLQENIIV